MQIKPTGNNSFKAKLYPYPYCITNKKIHELFEARTVKFPNWDLLQDNISFVGGDQFFLVNRVTKEVIFDAIPFTSDKRLQTIDDYVNSLVSIFNKMIKKSSIKES